MAKRQLFLHIGPHKTGSTSIQRGLVANKAALKKQGYHYPDVCYVFDGHHNLVFDLNNMDKFVPMLGGLKEFVEFAQNSDGNIILSSEAFDNIVTVEPIWKLQRALGDDFEIHAIGYLRPQTELLQSLWKTEVRFDGIFDDFKDWLPGAMEKWKFLEYGHWVNVWVKALGKDNTHFNIYNPSTDSLLFDFLKICGLTDFSSFELPNRENVSLPSLTFELVRRLYINPYIIRRRDEHGKIPVQKSSYANVSRVVSQYAKKHGIDLGYSSYDRETLKMVREHYIPHNRVAARYFDQCVLFETKRPIRPTKGKLIELLTKDQLLDLTGHILDMEREWAKKEIARLTPKNN